MLKLLNVLRRLIDVVMADGKKRVKFAIENVIYTAFAVICIWGAYELWQYVDGLSSYGCSGSDFGYGLLAILGIFICIGTGIYTFIAGVASQAVLLVVSLIGCFTSDSKARNLVAFLISLASLAVAIVGALLLMGVI